MYIHSMISTNLHCNLDKIQDNLFSIFGVTLNIF